MHQPIPAAYPRRRSRSSEPASPGRQQARPAAVVPHARLADDATTALRAMNTHNTDATALGRAGLPDPERLVREVAAKRAIVARRAARPTLRPSHRPPPGPRPRDCPARQHLLRPPRVQPGMAAVRCSRTRRSSTTTGASARRARGASRPSDQQGPSLPRKPPGQAALVRVARRRPAPTTREPHPDAGVGARRSHRGPVHCVGKGKIRISGSG
jgi:hypothetical protein